jgi:hypothetical protein
MTLEPYISVASFRFGDEIEKALLQFGPAEKNDFDREGKRQLHYPSFILRFNPETNTFIEFTALPSCMLYVHDLLLPWDAGCLKVLGGLDSDLREIYGFIVSFRLGIALSGFHDVDEPQKAIHAFMRGDWDCLVDERTKSFIP